MKGNREKERYPSECTSIEIFSYFWKCWSSMSSLHSLCSLLLEHTVSWRETILTALTVSHATFMSRKKACLQNLFEHSLYWMILTTVLDVLCVCVHSKHGISLSLWDKLPFPIQNYVFAYVMVIIFSVLVLTADSTGFLSSKFLSQLMA